MPQLAEQFPLRASDEATTPEADTLGLTRWVFFVAGPQGELLCELGQEEAIQIVEVNLTRSESVRRWWPFLRDRRIDYFEDLTKRYRK